MDTSIRSHIQLIDYGGVQITYSLPITIFWGDGAGNLKFSVVSENELDLPQTSRSSYRKYQTNTQTGIYLYLVGSCN